MSKIGDKLDGIYKDLSTNVTQIYDRDNLHFALDLVFHGVLSFNLGREKIFKGYPEVLIVGDTRCGKSETSEKLVNHYRLGQIASGENSSFSGLVGGVQQVRNRWSITWGKIPLNHKRLLIIDEVSGLSYEDIGNLSQIRSSGVAEITKIVTEKTQARTRLAWLSNPRKNATVSDFGSGTDLIINLIGKPEDVARFDFAIVLANSDVDKNLINDPNMDAVEHVYTSQLCHDLILWAWSRTPDQVIISEKTYRACVYFAKLMFEKYSDECPLVKAEEQKKKLARCAVSLACRLFSTSTGEDVIVTPEHVEHVYNFLCAEYDRPKFGYDLWSQNKKKAALIADPVKVKEELDEMGGRAVASQILDMRQVTVKGIEEAVGCADRSQAVVHVSKLLRHGALKSYQTYYFKTPGFIDILKDYIHNDLENIREEF